MSGVGEGGSMSLRAGSTSDNTAVAGSIVLESGFGGQQSGDVMIASESNSLSTGKDCWWFIIYTKI
jgi:hypothetical protein